MEVQEVEILEERNVNIDDVDVKVERIVVFVAVASCLNISNDILLSVSIEESTVTS